MAEQSLQRLARTRAGVDRMHGLTERGKSLVEAGTMIVTGVVTLFAGIRKILDVIAPLPPEEQPADRPDASAETPSTPPQGD